MTLEENQIVQHEEHSSQELPPQRYFEYSHCSSWPTYCFTTSNVEIRNLIFRVPIPVFILFFCIGFAPWLLVNGVWLQMADLVTVTSEHASIAAYLSLSLQFSNIVAFIYVIIQNYRPIPHNYSICFILIFNIITSVLFSFLWDKQTHIFGTTHSVALIILMFFAGMVGCLSVVVLYPWVSLYNVNLTSALSTGMGSSGLLASIIALIERPSDNIRLLSVDWFFRLLGIILCVSFVCFVYVIKNDAINKLKTKQQQLKPVKPSVAMVTGIVVRGRVSVGRGS